MRNSIPLIAAAVPVLALAGLTYPPSPAGSQVDDYFGTKVADPYRWLEELDSPATRAWVAAQNRLTDAQLASMPECDSIRKRLTELWNYERTSVPDKRASRYFYSRNNGLQNQSPIFVREGLRSPPRLLIDPNALSADGTVAVAVASPSPDGRWFGYGLAKAGSDWRELRLRDVATGEDAPDVVRWAKFTDINWTHDSAGFFYGRYPTPPGSDARVFSRLENRMVCYHRLGTPQSEDTTVFVVPGHPDRFPGAEVSSDGRYLVIGVSEPGRPGNSVAIIDLVDGTKPRLGGNPVTLVESFEHNYEFVGSAGSTLYFATDDGAPRNQIVAFDAAAGEPSLPRVVIPESADTLVHARLSAGKFVVTYLHDVTGRVAVFGLDGSMAGEIPLPGIGSVTEVTGNSDDPEVFVGFSSFLSPGTILRHDLSTGNTEVWHETKIPLDVARFEVRQEFYRSKDGTKIPIFVIAKKGMKLDGRNPGWLYGYGGFNIVMKPAFSVPPLVWVERGGVYAMACLRGGGEYGENWHLSGTKERKQKVFDDFIAAADWLSAGGFTSHERLVIDGRSNGGLLVAAVINQRPDLCAAALPAVGVMDMLRYHKFTVGAAWASDYGNSDSEDGFRYLRAYSPVHTVKAGAHYPAVLVTTGDHDDRVFPAHSYKYTAVMQTAAAPDSGPILIHIESNAGHGGSSGTTPVSKTIEDWSLRMGFGAHFAGRAPLAAGISARKESSRRGSHE